MEHQIDNTKFIIQRFDNYISAANVKGNFLLAFNTLLTSGVILNYNKIVELVQCSFASQLIDITFCLLLISSLVTILLVTNAVYPFLISGKSKKENYQSHIFFNTVSEFKTDRAYHNSLSKLSDQDFCQDLSYQAYYLSQGLKNKYKNLRAALMFVYFELFCILFIIVLIVIF